MSPDLLRRLSLPGLVVGAALLVCAVAGLVVHGMGAPVALRPPEPAPTPTPSPVPPSAAVVLLAPTDAAQPADLRAGAVATADVTAVGAAADVLDGDPATAWRADGDARGRALRVTFPEPRLVTAVGVVNGHAELDPATGVDRYAEGRRVTAVTWVFDDGTWVEQRLDDGVRTVQRRQVEPVRTTTVTIRIDATTPPGDPSRDFTAIGDVELLGG